jgi:hypothetical protein
MLSLTYVSQVHPAAGTPGRLADAIVRSSVATNHQLQITGALVFTTAHFAQILEGPAASIDRLMGRICADGRHRLVRVLESRPIDRRVFPEWSMAYAGGPVTMDQFIARVLACEDEREGDPKLLSRLINHFALSRQIQGKLRGISAMQLPFALPQSAAASDRKNRALHSHP